MKRQSGTPNPRKKRIKKLIVDGSTRATGVGVEVTAVVGGDGTRLPTAEEAEAVIKWGTRKYEKWLPMSTKEFKDFKEACGYQIWLHEPQDLANFLSDIEGKCYDMSVIGANPFGIGGHQVVRIYDSLDWYNVTLKTQHLCFGFMPNFNVRIGDKHPVCLFTHDPWYNDFCGGRGPDSTWLGDFPFFSTGVKSYITRDQSIFLRKEFKLDELEDRRKTPESIARRLWGRTGNGYYILLHEKMKLSLFHPDPNAKFYTNQHGTTGGPRHNCSTFWLRFLRMDTFGVDQNNVPSDESVKCSLVNAVNFQRRGNMLNKNIITRLFGLKFSYDRSMRSASMPNLGGIHRHPYFNVDQRRRKHRQSRRKRSKKR